nr:formin-like protein 3 [Lolium perenne]
MTAASTNAGRAQTTSQRDAAHANGSMPCRPRGQRHSNTTTSLPEPPLRLPRATGRPLASTCHRRTPASLPHAVALRSPPNSDLHATATPRRSWDGTSPSPPRLRGRCPGILFSSQPPAPEMQTGLPCRLPAVGGTTPTPPTPLRRPRAAALASLSEADLHAPQIERISIWEDADQAAPQGPAPRATVAGAAATTAAPASSHHRSPPPRARRLGFLKPRPPPPPRAGPPPRAQNSPTTFGSGVPPPPRRRPPAAAAGEAKAGRSLAALGFRPWRRLGERREGASASF